MSPGFPVVALVTLALGIGVNTTAFTVLNRLLLQILPFHDSDSLVQIWSISARDGRLPTAPADYFDIKGAGHRVHRSEYLKGGRFKGSNRDTSNSEGVHLMVIRPPNSTSIYESFTTRITLFRVSAAETQYAVSLRIEGASVATERR